MKSSNFQLIRIDADEGKVFDWVDLADHTHTETSEDGKETVVQDHLYAKTLFIKSADEIELYIEVDEPKQEE